jgi:hypothetical protein
VPDPTEPHNGDSTEILVPPVELDDDDDLLAGDDPDLEGFDPDIPDELPPVAVDEPLPDDAAIDHLLAELPDDLEERIARLEAAVNGAAPAPAPAPAVDEGDERIKRLEEAAKALAEEALRRDRGRVRRKVSAASIGAFVAAAIPVLLQLVGALDLSPELTSTVSAAAALVGAFAAGWTTPERAPSVPPEAVQALGVKTPGA